MLSIKIAVLCVVFVAIGVQCEDSDDSHEPPCFIKSCPSDYPILVHPCECAHWSTCRIRCPDGEIPVAIKDGDWCRCRKPRKVPGRK